MSRNFPRPGYSPGTRLDAELVGTLQYVFITQRKYDLGKIALQLNMEYGDLYAYVSGRRTMPVELLKRITELTGDKIFLDTVFAGSNIRWEFVRTPAKHTGDPVKESFDVFSAVGEISTVLRRAIEDSRISDPERRELIQKIAVACKELNDLRDSLALRKEA